MLELEGALATFQTPCKVLQKSLEGRVSASKAHHSENKYRDLHFLRLLVCFWSENSRFLESITSYFLPSVVDKIMRFFFLEILSLNLIM
jgi:hypothetical protein